MKKIISIMLVVFTVFTGFVFGGVKETLSPEDYGYLLGLARDTWACIQYLIEPATGLPYDSSNKKNKYTSVSNIGAYIASLAIAVEMKFITREEAEKKLSLLLDSFEQFAAYNGFTQSWHDVTTLNPNDEDPWISLLDSGNLAAGMIVARQEFPKLNKRISKLLDAMDWAKFYNPSQKLLIGGYNMKTEKMNDKWLLSLMGTDARNAFIISIGSGKVPPAMWKTVSKGSETRYKMSYYLPGWQGGGLFMQFVDACFLDIRDTKMWRSAAAFARAQIFHAKMINAPVWGWSACDSPGEGYLGMNNLRDYVVTPHASVLPIWIYPKESLDNLRKLDELGARKEITINDTNHAFGFRDAIDYLKGVPTETYLMWDQGMLFLSLCNYLSDGKVWELSNKDSIIKNARELVPDLRPDKEDFDRYFSTLYPKNPFITVKSVNSKTEYKTGEKAQFDITVICDDKTVNDEYEVLWRLFDKDTGKKLLSGNKKVTVTEGLKEVVDSFPLTLNEGNYLLQAIIRDKDGAEYSRDNYNFSGLSFIDLAGENSFRTGDQQDWAKPEFDDTAWDKIAVPARWDDQGIKSKNDTYGWYRIHIDIPKEMKKDWKNGSVSFVAGGIDDADQVYFNGEPIGSTGLLPEFKEGFWDKKRNYPIPIKSVRFGKDNIIAVRVYNYVKEGGLWKGPVRIVHSKTTDKPGSGNLSAVPW